MSRILKVSNSDYRIKVKDSGSITLDTGLSLGTVFVTGDLVVKGNTTTINTTQTTIEDRIITLNKSTDGGPQDSTAGILDIGGTRQSGIEINRGTSSKAQLLFDENVSHYDPIVAGSIAGTFVIRTADGVLSGIRLASISPPDSFDMVFDMNNSLTKLKIVNITPANYVALLDNTIPLSADTAEDNFIPNKKYVTSYVSATGGQANVDNFHYISDPASTRGQAYSNYIKFTVSGQERARITIAGLSVDNVNLYQNTVSNTSALNNLVLTSSTTNQINIDSILNLKVQASNPSSVSGYGLIYAKDPGTGIGTPGKTGLYFVNTLTSDELISKNRAVLLSILL
jgi:hypothetical protein